MWGRFCRVGMMKPSLRGVLGRWETLIDFLQLRFGESVTGFDGFIMISKVSRDTYQLRLRRSNRSPYIA